MKKRRVVINIEVESDISIKILGSKYLVGFMFPQMVGYFKILQVQANVIKKSQRGGL